MPIDKVMRESIQRHAFAQCENLAGHHTKCVTRLGDVRKAMKWLRSAVTDGVVGELARREMECLEHEGDVLTEMSDVLLKRQRDYERGLISEDFPALQQLFQEDRVRYHA